MKVAIVCINSKYVHASLAPWCLASGIESYAPSVCYEVLEYTVNQKREEIAKDLLSHSFDLVGFCTYIWNVKETLFVAEQVKAQRKNVFTVLGGPEVSYRAEQVLTDYSFVDFVICGEGEGPFASLCAGKDYSDIDGLCYRENGNIVVKEPYLSKGDPPSPFLPSFFDRLQGRISYLETSRGCPFRCAFCLSGRCGTVRFFDLENAKKMILQLGNSSTQTVKFIDRTFNANLSRSKEILRFILDRYGKEIKDGVCFHFEIAGDLVDDEWIDLLAKSKPGTFQVEIGMQSFNEQTLAYIHRKTDTAKLVENIKKIVALQNVHVHIDLIAGLPYEDFSSFENSFNLACTLGAQMLQFGFLKLLHGADMREEKSRYVCEFDENPPYEVTSTPWLSHAEICRMHDAEDVFDRFYNSGRFSRTFSYVSTLVPSVFSLMLSLADFLKNKPNQTLDQFSENLFSFLKIQENIDEETLLEKMILDRLASNKNATLPPFLKVPDRRIKQCLIALDKNPLTARKIGVKRSCTVLPKEELFVFVDYEKKNPVTGEYPLFEKKLSDFRF